MSLSGISWITVLATIVIMMFVVPIGMRVLKKG